MVVALPVLQLVPLPPALWHAFKGREVAQASLALVGAADSWRPLSLIPSRTVASLLVMAPAAAMMLMTASLPRGGRATVLAVVTAVAVLGLLAGAGQMAGGEGNAFRFYDADVGFLNGFQANHNSAADVLLIAMVGFAATVRELAEYRQRMRLARGFRLGLVLAASLLFSLGDFLTASRMGMALLPVAWIGVFAVVRPWLEVDRRHWRWLGLALILLAAAGAYLIGSNHVIERVMARFDFGGEVRPQIWQDSLYAARQYFPYGAGMGTFVPVYQAAEHLEAVGTTIVNRAHNDYLELLVEAGIPGIMLLAAIGWNVSGAAIRGLRRPPAGSHGQVVFSTAALAVIALHSLVDYPLRSMSLAFVAAICAGLLMAAPGGGKPGDRNA